MKNFEEETTESLGTIVEGTFNPSVLHKLTERQIGWIAGILDGEGYITIGKGHHQYNPRIAVGMTSAEVINALYVLTGLGSVYSANRRITKHKLLFTWLVAAHRHIQALLDCIGPSLVCKRKQAIVLTAFISAKFVYHDYQKQETLYNKMRELNQRGVLEDKEVK